MDGMSKLKSTCGAAGVPDMFIMQSTFVLLLVNDLPMFRSARLTLANE